MLPPQRETVTLEDIVITEELSRRTPRTANLLLENQALHALARQLVNQPETMLQSLVDIAVDLCYCGTAGVSLLETTTDGEEVFRWNVLAGTLSEYVGGTTPRNFSPCGICLDRGTPVLYSHPERYFTYFQAVNTPFVEGLVIPLIADNQALGTIWIVSHDEQRHFDSEDVRVMTSLADFTAATLLLNQRQTKELLAANAALEAEIVERKQTEAKLREVQRRLELSVTGANLGIWTYNIVTDEFWADDRAKFMHGHAPHEVHTFAEAGVNIYPEDRDRAQAAFAQAIINRSKLQIEYRAIKPDDSVNWIASYAEIIPTGDRDEGIFYGVVQDISERQAALRERKRAETQLRESEERSRALIENLPGGAAFVVDRNLRYLLAEGEALSAAGFKSEDLVGHTIFEVMPPELTVNYEQWYRQGLAGEPFEYEHNAHDRSYVSRGTPLRLPNGEVYALLAVSYDISDRKKAEATLRESEARQVFLLRLSDVLRSLADPVEIQEAVTQTTLNYFGADRCYYCEIEDGNAIISRDAARNLPSIAGVYPLSRFAIFQVVVDAGRPFIVRDVHTSDMVDEDLRQLCIQLQVISFVDVPIIKNGKPVGILCLVQSTPRDWTDLEVELAVETTERTWAAVERARTEAALAKSEEKYRSLFETIGEGFCIFELIDDETQTAIDYRFLEVNQVFKRQTKLENAVGKLGSEIAPNTERYWLEAYDQVARTGEPLRLENYNQSTGRWYVAYASRVGGAGSRQVCTVFDDITDRKQAEQELTKTNQLLQATFDNSLQVIQLFKAVRDERGDIADFEWLLTNKQWNDQWGKMAGKRLLRENPAVVETGLFDMFKQVTESGVPITHEHYYAYEQFDGWFLQTIAQVEDGFLLSTINITERKRAEAALRESKEKYRGLFDAIDVGFCIIEVLFDPQDKPFDYRFLEANPAFIDQTGLTNAIGRTILEFAPEHETFWFDVYGEIALTGKPARFEHQAEALPSYRWYEVYAFRIGEPEARHVAVLFRDIADRKQAETKLRRAAEMDAFRLELSDVLRSLSDAVEIQATVTRTTLNFFGADRCYYCEIIDGNAIVRQDATQEDVPSVVGVYPLDSSPIFRAMLDAGEPFVFEDAHTTNVLDENLRQTCLQLQIVSAINVPVIKQGEPVGILCMTQSTPRNWTAFEMDLAEETAERTWATIERARAEAAVEEDLRDTQMLHNLATRLIFEEDIQALYQEIVKTAIALTQADAGSFQFLDKTTQELVLIATQGINRTLTEHFYRLDASSNTSCGIALATGERIFINFDVLESEDPDGSRRMHKDAGLLCVQSTPLLSRSGKPIGMVSTHWREDHRLSDRELRFLDLLARQAADIIEQRQAEENRIQLIHEQSAREEERQRAESLAELDRAKTLFFSNISHEFRTPLTLILAPLQDALSDAVNPLAQAQRERLELAHRNSSRLLKLVNTLLDFSRIEAGRMEAVYEPTDLALFTTELASVFRSAIERAGLRLVVDCPPLPEPVYVDREMWEKIVLNLLSNAFKFTLEGEIAVRLHLADEHHVTLQIEDTGSGIEPEELPHLMERFYQVRVTKARTHEGSGIGLALVQELIKMHGGTVEVNSTPKVGSCFTVTILLGTAHLPSDRLQLDVGDRTTTTRTLTSTALGAAPYVQEAERWLLQDSDTTEVGEAAAKTISANSKTISTNSKTISTNSETISANSKTISTNSKTISANSKTISTNSETRTSFPNPPAHILIVDDNADMRDYLKRILSEHNVEVEAVADGAAALAIVTERVPSLVLSDVMMPLLDGFELLKALRADARTKEVPIILLSARAGEESVIEGLQAGADDYLIKPFSATELVTRVLAHLQMAQLRSQALHHEKTINRMKDKFLAEVSHELNTPLVAILGWTRLLRSSPPNQAMLTKSLETIERNATLQAKLVQDLLDISRITAGKIHLNLEPVELQEVIETAIATVRQSLETKDIRLQCLLDPSPTIVQGDPDRLQQIILNLLTNAVKFTPQKGRIKVCVETNETQAQISVSDTGCGIDAEFLPYIFETFRQASSSKKGLGLGLAIARNLIELHGGTIHAQSPGVGQGATFIIELPLIIHNS